MIDFRFNAEDHSYWLGARRLPSVTQILDDCGLIYHASDEALERGHRVHEACALLLQGRLDWASVDPRIFGWVSSARTLNFEAFGKIEEIETPRFHSALKVAGTPDLITELDILDFKTGAPAPWHKAQLGGYWYLAGQNRQLISVYLQEDGSLPKLISHTPTEAGRDFLTCYNFYQLRSKYNGNRLPDNPRNG